MGDDKQIPMKPTKITKAWIEAKYGRGIGPATIMRRDEMEPASVKKESKQ